MMIETLAAEKKKSPDLWRYTDLAPFLQDDFLSVSSSSSSALPAPLVEGGARLVFRDGALDAAASCVPEGLFRLSEDKGEVRLDVPASVCLAIDPLELLFVNEAGSQALEAKTDIVLKLAASARLTLVERHLGQGAGKPFAHRLVLKAHLAAGAKLVHGRLYEGGASHLFFGEIAARLAEGAMLDQSGFLLAGRLIRQTVDVTLLGRKASAHVNGVMLPGADEQMDTLTFMRHEAPGGTSRQLFKTALFENGRGVFQGLVRVEKGADQTDAAQTSRALLLSSRAEMNARPELEIFADDVACSHGSAIGDLDRDMLFYLQARGIAEDEARRLLVGAFLAEGLAALPPVLQEEAKTALTRRLDVLSKGGNV